MITSLVLGREPNDCAIASLAMYLNRSYEDALRAVSHADNKAGGKQGLFLPQIKRAAKLLGQPLRLKKKFIWEEDYGILLLSDHACILRNGLVIDPDGSVWEWDDFLSHYAYQPTQVEGLLVASPKFRGTRPERFLRWPVHTTGSRPEHRMRVVAART